MFQEPSGQTTYQGFMENPAPRSPGVKKVYNTRTSDINQHHFNFVFPFPAHFSHLFFTPVLSPFLSLAFVTLFGRVGDKTQGLENAKQVFSTNKLHLQPHFIAFYPRYSTIEALVKVKIGTAGETRQKTKVHRQV